MKKKKTELFTSTVYVLFCMQEERDKWRAKKVENLYFFFRSGRPEKKFVVQRRRRFGCGGSSLLFCVV